MKRLLFLILWILLTTAVTAEEAELFDAVKEGDSLFAVLKIKEIYPGTR